MAQEVFLGGVVHKSSECGGNTGATAEPLFISVRSCLLLHQQIVTNTGKRGRISMIDAEAAAAASQ